MSFIHFQRRVVLTLGLMWSSTTMARVFPEDIILKEANEFAREFDKEFKVNDSGVRIIVVPEWMMGESAGICYIKSRTIMFGSKYWKDLGVWQKRRLVYHEKLHCEFRVDHLPALDVNKDPVSIMHPSVEGFTDDKIARRWAYYLKQAHSMVGDPKFLIQD